MLAVEALAAARVHGSKGSGARRQNWSIAYDSAHNKRAAAGARGIKFPSHCRWFDEVYDVSVFPLLLNPRRFQCVQSTMS